MKKTLYVTDEKHIICVQGLRTAKISCWNTDRYTIDVSYKSSSDCFNYGEEELDAKKMFNKLKGALEEYNPTQLERALRNINP